MRHSRRMGSRFVLRCMLDTKLRTKISTIIIDPNKISQPPQRCPFKNNVTTFHIMFNFFGKVNQAKLLYHLKKYFTIVSTQVQDPISHRHINIYLGQDTTRHTIATYKILVTVQINQPRHATTRNRRNPPWPAAPTRPDPARHTAPWYTPRGAPSASPPSRCTNGKQPMRHPHRAIDSHPRPD
jgi:hypothetical protein